MDDLIWENLYNRAKQVLNARTISPFIEVGSCASAVLTSNGNTYVGICIDTACTLGMCAERNAIANMLTNGDSKIVKLVCVISNGNVGAPCGACREYLMQLDENSGNMEILTNLARKETIKLAELLPSWWGKRRFDDNNT